MNKLSLVLLTLALLINTCWTITSRAAEGLSTVAAVGRILYVSPTGEDSGSGTIDDPIDGLRHACEVARPGDQIYLRKGIYTDVLQPRNSGLPGQPVIFSRYKDESVLLVSGLRIDRWKALENGVYVADCSVDLGAGQNQLTCNGELMIEARTPNIEDRNEIVHAFGLHKVYPTISEKNSIVICVSGK